MNNDSDESPPESKKAKNKYLKKLHGTEEIKEDWFVTVAQDKRHTQNVPGDIVGGHLYICATPILSRVYHRYRIIEIIEHTDQYIQFATAEGEAYERGYYSDQTTRSDI